MHSNTGLVLYLNLKPLIFNFLTSCVISSNVDFLIFILVSEFFKIPDELNKATHLSEKIRSAAYSRIEEAKQRTKEELKKNINSLLKGDAAGSTADSRRAVWDVVFDLCAPQILVPEHFIDRQALIMLIDFGKLHFTNKTGADFGGKIETDEEEDDDDDEFCTPASSPGSFKDEESPPRTG